MNHFLITRFNIRVDDWTKTRDGHHINQSDWLDHRFELFNKYCLPSVKNQSDQDFDWLVFFDTSTPLEFKELNETMSLRYSNFKPIYVDGISSFLPSLIRELTVRTKSDYLITSRLDNDDLIHENYISRVKQEARPSNELLIDMERGYQLIQRRASRHEVRNYIHRFNPFISLVEPASNIQSVMSKNHREWKIAKEVVKINDMPYWVEHIHDKNKLNAARNQLTLKRKTNWEDFGLKERVKTSGYIKVLLVNISIKLNRLSIRIKRFLSI